MSQDLNKEQIQKEILELKLKKSLTTEDKKRIQKLQQLLDKK
jgi:hypothetical protein